jgi:hypothetical protein
MITLALHSTLGRLMLLLLVLGVTLCSAGEVLAARPNPLVTLWIPSDNGLCEGAPRRLMYSAELAVAEAVLEADCFRVPATLAPLYTLACNDLTSGPPVPADPDRVYVCQREFNASGLPLE